METLEPLIPEEEPPEAEAEPEAPGEAPAPLDVNTADREALIALPGIGPALADRILAARPFSDLDDLQRVSGIGPALLERLAGQITVLPLEEAESGVSPEEIEALLWEEEALPEAVTEEAEALPAEAAEGEVAPPAAAGEAEAPTQTAAEPPTQAAAPEPPRLVTRTEALWMALGSGLLAFLLSLVVILGLLAGLNGGLRFVRPADLAALDRRVAGIQRQAETLTTDLNALRDRVNNLQNLTPRVEHLETSLRATEQQIGDLNAQAQALQQQADDLAAQVDGLQQQATLFDEFLNGLRDLLNNLLLMAPQGGAQ